MAQKSRVWIPKSPLSACFDLFFAATLKKRGAAEAAPEVGGGWGVLSVKGAAMGIKRNVPEATRRKFGAFFV